MSLAKRSVAISLYLFVIAIFGIYVWYSITAFQHPFNTSTFDDFWAYVYLGITISIGVLIWPLRGRLLLALSLLTVVVLICITVFRARTGPSIAALLWLILLAQVIGNRILLLVARDLDVLPLERVVVGIPLGFGSLTLLFFAIAKLNMLYSLVVLGVLAGLTILFALDIKKLALNLIALRPFLIFRRDVDSNLRVPALLAACCAVSFAAAFVWAISPETRYDALNYQLAIPQIYVQHHGLVEVPYTFWSYFVGNTGMLYALGLSLTGQPLPQLTHLLFGLLLANQAFLLGLRFMNVRVGLLAATFLYTVPIVTWESGTGYIDLIVSLYAFGAVYTAILWSQKKGEGWLVVTGLMAGFAVAAKLNAIISLVPLGILIAFYLIKRPYSWKDRANIVLLRLALPSLLVSAPWFVLRVIWTGNPVFPFLNGIFRSPNWPPENTLFNFADFGGGKGLLALFVLPWNLTVRTDLFAEAAPTGILGALPLMSIPLFFFFSDRNNRSSARWLVFIGLAGILMWFRVGQFARYLLPILPIMAFIAAVNVEYLLREIEGKSFVARSARAITLLVALSYLAATGLVNTLWHWHIPDRFPYQLALGLESREQFLSRAVPVYPALKFLNNEESGRSKVLSIGNEFRLYTTAEIVGTVGSRTASALATTTADSNLAQVLKRHGYGYLLVNWTQVRATPGLDLPMLHKEFLSTYARLLFARNNVEVYKLLPSETATESSEPINILKNPGFEQINAEGLPIDWTPYGKPVVDRTGKRSHTGLSAVQVNKLDGFYANATVEPGQIYSVGHWTRSDRPNQFARLQINWLDANLQITDVSLTLVPAESQWAWHQLAATAPEKAVFAFVYASVHEEAVVWLDDFVFVRGTSIPTKPKEPAKK